MGLILEIGPWDFLVSPAGQELAHVVSLGLLIAVYARVHRNTRRIRELAEEVHKSNGGKDLSESTG